MDDKNDKTEKTDALATTTATDVVSTACVDRALLARELRAWLADNNGNAEPLARVAIRHDGTRPAIRAFNAPDRADAAAVDRWIDDIARKMESDAGGYNGATQRYFVEGYFGTDTRPAARQPFCLAVDDGDDGDNPHGPTEKPTHDGALALVMRLADNSHGRSLTSWHQLTKELRNELASKRVEIRELQQELKDARTEIGEMRGAYESMLSQKHERDLMTKESEQRRRLFSEAFHEVRLIAPVLLNRMAGQRVLPESDTPPEMLLLRRIVQELDSPDIHELIMGIAEKKPQVAIAISELVMKVQGEEAERIAKATAAKQAQDEIEAKNGPKAA
jgi:hypothetical protein